MTPPDPDRELAEARVAEAAAARRAARRERELQAEETTLRDVLAAAADSGRAVVVTVGGRRIVGVVTDVGDDVVVCSPSPDRVTAWPISVIESVELRDSSAVGVGSVPLRSPGPSLREVVADLVGTGLSASFVVGAGTHLDGVVLGVGQDLVIVGAGGPQTVYVALDSLNEVAWSSSAG